MTRRSKKAIVAVAATLLVALIVGVAALPSLIRWKINSGLADMGEGYRGQVRDVDFDLLGGTVIVKGFEIERPKPSAGAPFLTVDEIRGGAVFRDGGEPKLALTFVSPVVNIVDAEGKARDQLGPPFTLQKLREQLPLDLGEVHLRDMEIHLRRFSADPPVDAYVQALRVDASPLDHCIQASPAGCDAEIEASGRIMKTSKLRMRARLDGEHGRTLQGALHVRALRLPELEPLLIQYAALSFERGDLDLDATFSVGEQRYALELRPSLHDAEVVGDRSEDERVGVELLTGLITGVLERRSGDLEIAIEGGSGRELEWEIRSNEHASAE